MICIITLRLTPREREILSAIALGMTNEEAAKSLLISPRTVQFHLANIYAKLGVKNRVQAIRKAIIHGLIDPIATGAGT
jgi:DNA-binding CsgD family transcriptional regulator